MANRYAVICQELNRHAMPAYDTPTWPSLREAMEWYLQSGQSTRSFAICEVLPEDAPGAGNQGCSLSVHSTLNTCVAHLARGHHESSATAANFDGALAKLLRQYKPRQILGFSRQAFELLWEIALYQVHARALEDVARWEAARAALDAAEQALDTGTGNDLARLLGR